MSRFVLGGRTPYNLAWQDEKGLVYTQMTVMGPADIDEAKSRVLADRCLGDWASIRNGKTPMLVGLKGRVALA